MNIFSKTEHYLVGDIVYKKSAALGPRIQSGLQVMYVYSGSARIMVDGRERILDAGKMTLLLPDHVEFFEFSKSEQTHHGWCTAVSSELAEWKHRGGEGLTDIWPIAPQIRSLTDRAVILRQQKSIPAQTLYRQIAQMIFCEYFYAAGYPSQADPPLPEPVRRACAWIDEHYADPCALEDVARAAGITGAHLIRLFKAHLNQTPIRRLWAVRCDAGRRLLAETGLSIAEVAYRCGYQTPYHFSREFKARNGLSPRDYRKEQWSR